MRSAAILACVAWSVRTLGCDPPGATTKSAFVDSDGDGLSDTDEVVIHGTSPLLADTDGDGMSDYDEIVLHGYSATSSPLRFNPRVADLPVLDVRIVGPPLLTFRFTLTNGETWTYETATTFEEGTSFTWGTSQEVSFSDTVGASDTVTKEVSLEFSDESLLMSEPDGGAEDGGSEDRVLPGTNQNQNPNSPVLQRRPLFFDPGGPDLVVLTSTVSSTVDWSATDTLTLSFSAEQTREFRRAITFVQAYAVNREISTSSCDLKVLVELYNRGTVPFRISNLILAATLIGGPGVQIPVGNLDLNTFFNNFVPWSLPPGGKQGPINYVRDALTVDQGLSLGDMSGLQVNVGVFELTKGDGLPYAFDVPTITARTATLDIDYGGKRPHERFQVATNLDPGHPGVTMRRALEEILRVPFVADSERGLTSMRNVATADPGKWTVELRHSADDREVINAFTPPYEFGDILLRAGDVVHLTWSPP